MIPTLRRVTCALLAGALALPAFRDASAGGCAMCRTAVSSVDDPGLNAGILFLMAMPFALAGSLGGVLYLANRRKRSS